MTRLELFTQKWHRGCGSDQCSKARVVLFKGTLPCDLLFVGEAPGESENVLGRPFMGPAGKLLDSIIEDAVDTRDIRCAFTNVVGCIPRESTGDKAKEPEHEQILQCQGRLSEFIRLANPRLVVCVGALARDYTDPMLKDACPIQEDIPRVSITHPAAILRANVTNRGLMRQRAVVTLRNAVLELE
jgi:DNA polymerase